MDAYHILLNSFKLRITTWKREKSVNLDKVEAHGDDGSENPVGKTGETHGTRSGALTEQLGGDHHWYGAWNQSVTALKHSVLIRNSKR